MQKTMQTGSAYLYSGQGFNVSASGYMNPCLPAGMKESPQGRKDGIPDPADGCKGPAAHPLRGTRPCSNEGRNSTASRPPACDRAVSQRERNASGGRRPIWNLPKPHATATRCGPCSSISKSGRVESVLHICTDIVPEFISFKNLHFLRKTCY